MSKSVLCTAATTDDARMIVEELREAGFSNDDISVLLADKSGTRDFAHEQNTKAPEGAVTGAGTGAALGGALGWMAGIGALAIPGLGPLIAAGPIMAALTGAAVGGTVGGLTGALIGLGIPEVEAKRYEGKVKGGRALIAVHTQDADECRAAKDLFERVGAEDIATAGEATVSSKTR